MSESVYKQVINDPFTIEGPAGRFQVNNLQRGDLDEAHRAALEHAAQQVEAAGCLSWPCGKGKAPALEHDSRCPIALAAKIREGR